MMRFERGSFHWAALRVARVVPRARIGRCRSSARSPRLSTRGGDPEQIGRQSDRVRRAPRSWTPTTVDAMARRPDRRRRDFCVVAICEAGRVRSAGRIATSPEALALFAQSLGSDDRVALEVTGGALEIARVLGRKADAIAFEAE